MSLYIVRRLELSCTVVAMGMVLTGNFSDHKYQSSLIKGTQPTVECVYGKIRLGILTNTKDYTTIYLRHRFITRFSQEHKCLSSIHKVDILSSLPMLGS